MSLYEFFMVCVVALLVVRPKDVPFLISKFKQARAFFAGAKKELISYLDIEDSENIFDHETEQINYYIEKIAKLDSQYHGEYNLPSIKAFYRKLVDKELEKGRSKSQ